MSQEKLQWGHPKTQKFGQPLHGHCVIFHVVVNLDRRSQLLDQLQSQVQSLANELWPRRIDVNNLIPGPVATSGLTNDKTGKLSKPDAILDHFGGKLPPNFPEWERLKHPDEVAEFALWLASLPVGGPTGQTFSLARRPL